MKNDPFQYKLAYITKELGLSFSELAIAQIWTPTHVPFTGVRDGKLNTQVMQTCQHPTVLGDTAFQEFRAKSCKQGITGQALGMLGKVWCSGVLQVVQDVSIVPVGVHPRNKLEHLRSPSGTGLMDLLAEIVYVPVYDETDPDTGVIAVLEVLMLDVGRESLLANLISAVGNILAELQLSLAKPDPDAEVPMPGSLPPVLIPSDPMDMAHCSAPSGIAASPFADMPGAGSFSVPDHMAPVGSWQGTRMSAQPSSPTLSPRQSQLRSYGTPMNSLKYGSPPTAPIRYGFLDTAVLVPRPGSPLPCATADVMAVMGDFSGLSVLQGMAPGMTAAYGWAAVAAREASPPTDDAPEGAPPGGQPAPARQTSIKGWLPHKSPSLAPRQSQLSRTLSRTSTTRFLDTLDQEALPLPCPCSKPCSKGFPAYRQTLAAGL